MKELLKKAEAWFSNLSLEYKSRLFNEDIESFDSYNGYEEANNYFCFKWSRIGESVKTALYGYFTN